MSVRTAASASSRLGLTNGFLGNGLATLSLALASMLDVFLWGSDLIRIAHAESSRVLGMVGSRSTDIRPCCDYMCQGNSVSRNTHVTVMELSDLYSQRILEIAANQP